MKNLAKLGLLATIIVLTSCATIFTGTSDRMSFTSEPPGATVFIDGNERCITPCNVRVTRSLNERDVTISLYGYEVRMITLDREFNLVSILNLGNLLGWGIDALSGAIFMYEPESYHVTLTPIARTGMMHPVKIYINEENKRVDLYVTQNPPSSVVNE
ncbi:MAG TPA: PEGA domain-containing protein [Bacteroidales bacterium]|nr:PEGA domain-containing protein [Bacteroidales bacterium]